MLKFNGIENIKSALAELDLGKCTEPTKAEINALIQAVIPNPIRDIERAIDPLYDFREFVDLGLRLSEKIKRKRDGPEFCDRQGVCLGEDKNLERQRFQMPVSFYKISIQQDSLKNHKYIPR